MGHNDVADLLKQARKAAEAPAAEAAPAEPEEVEPEEAELLVSGDVAVMYVTAVGQTITTDAMREVLSRPIAKVPALRGVNVTILFYEASTRTRVSFEVAAKGGQVEIRAPLEVECPRCEGKGAEPGTKVETCPQCGGSGSVSLVQGGFAVQRPCPRCYGRGTLIEEPCTRCRGEGSVTEPRRVKVRIPPLTEDGDRIRMRGQGEPGPAGGPPGDLVLSVRVKPDRFFRREGLDIHCTVPITIVQAMLGAKIRVRTIHGKKVEVRVPPGTQSGTRLRLRGQGLVRDGEKGDQIVEIQVKVPEKLTDEERELVEQLGQKLGE